MSELNNRILEAVQNSPLSDSDQRSAIGMARTWVDKQIPIERSTISGFEKRDDLAERLVAIMEEESADAEERVDALREAREAVNRPYQGVERRNGHAKHIELLKPKEKKKGTLTT